MCRAKMGGILGLGGRMFLDLILAIAHHLLIFTLAAALAAEFILVRPGLAGRELRLLAKIDQAFGGVALAVIVVGILRVFFGLKGWEFYVYNLSFWLKMAAFLTVGLLSIQPTLPILGWRRQAERATGLYVVPDNEITLARRMIRWEAMVFLLIPFFAAIMARGVGA
jgi:putative membrane protein